MPAKITFPLDLRSDGRAGVRAALVAHALDRFHTVKRLNEAVDQVPHHLCAASSADGTKLVGVGQGYHD